MQLASAPSVIKLAKDLGLLARGDCLGEIRSFAIRQVQRIIEESPIPIASLDDLRRMVANKYRMKLEFLNSDDDVGRLADEHARFHSQFRECITAEFIDGSTEGITIEREHYDHTMFRYLAVVDARGERAARAYFTAWHEVTHLVVHPARLNFPGFRRSPAVEEVAKDPLESVVDHVAGRLAFYGPLYKPAIEAAMISNGGLTFRAIDAAREAAAPSASLFATAIGSINFAAKPTVFISAEMAFKANERRALDSPQQAFAFAKPQATARLRVTTVIRNELTTGSDIAIQRNMRVPNESVLARAFAETGDVDLAADEDQSWWEASLVGALPPLPLRVYAARRGRFVYGLIADAS